MARFLTIFILCSWLTNAKGQVSAVVVNEAGLPIRNLTVTTDAGTAYTTNFRGIFSIKENFKTITIAGHGYLSRIMNRSEITDTIMLLPYMLNEFVVYGKRRDKTHFKKNPFRKADPTTGVRKPTGINLLGWLNIFDRKRHRSSKKEREMNEKIWREY